MKRNTPISELGSVVEAMLRFASICMMKFERNTELLPCQSGGRGVTTCSRARHNKRGYPLMMGLLQRKTKRSGAWMTTT